MRFLLVLALVACKGEPVNVAVHCETTNAPALVCEAKQTLGTAEVEACWDFEVTCANGAVVGGPRNCVKVKDGGTAKLTVPADKLTGIDKCGGDKPPTGKLSNLTIEGRPAEVK